MHLVPGELGDLCTLLNATVTGQPLYVREFVNGDRFS